MRVRQTFTSIAALLSLAVSGLVATSCNDTINEDSNDGDTGLLVRLDVVDEQQARLQAQYGQGSELPRTALNELGFPTQFTSADLASRTINLENDLGMNAILVENTVEGINPVKPEPHTRGNAISGITTDFNVSARRATDASGVLGAVDWINNATFDSKGRPTGTQFRWSSKKPYARFYATSQTAGTNGMGQMAWNNGKVAFTLTTPAAVEDQYDLMAAVSDTIRYAGDNTVPRVGLAFRHVLTAINFRIGNNLSAAKKAVTGVKFTGVHGSGSYSFTHSKALGTWTVDGSTSTFEKSGLNLAIKGIGQTIMGNGTDNLTFFFIPQSLNGVRLVVTFDDGSELAANLTGQWLAGTTKTYTLSEKNTDWSYIFNTSVVDPFRVDNLDRDTTFNVNVTSYRYSASVSGSQAPIAWKVVGYQVKQGTDWSATRTGLPSWLSVSSNGGKGGTDADRFSITAKAATPSEVEDKLDEYNSSLREEHGLPFGYNLGMSNGVDPTSEAGLQNTANTYVISKSGFYRIPLYYGNAIVNGKERVNTYRLLTDHLGNYIQPGEGKIPYNYCKSAEVLWSDPQGAITDTQILHLSQGDYLGFRVDPSHVASGNAVVAVKDSKGRIVWSWQLWFAKKDEVEKTVVTPKTYYANRTIDFMRMPLGWTYTSWKTLKNTTGDVSIRLVLEQEVSGKKEYVIITRNSETFGGYAALYQYGRKDPFLSNRAKMDQLGFKFADLTPNTESKRKNPSLMVLNPMTFATVTGNTPSAYYNLANGYGTPFWDYNNGSQHFGGAEKSIYDPSPVGFRVATSETIDFIADYKDKLPEGTLIARNGILLNVNNGGERLFMPFYNVLDKEGHEFNNVDDLGQTSTYWLTHPGRPKNDATYGANGTVKVTVSSAHLNYKGTALQNMGLGIRPVKDKFQYK
jgi:conserved domain protein